MDNSTNPITDDSAPKLKHLVVDDDAFNREGLRAYLAGQGFEVAEAGDEASAWEAAQATSPAAAVIDISIPASAAQRTKPTDSFGLSLARRLKQAHPALGIVLFSAYEDRGDDVMTLMRAGYRSLAYKLKGCPPSDLLSAIHDVLAGRVVIDPEVTGRKSLAAELLNQLTPDEREHVSHAVAQLEELTQREREIAYRIAASQNVKGIALALHLSPKSVENNITTIYSKLGLNVLPPNLREVVILAKACMVKDLQRVGE